MADERENLLQSSADTTTQPAGEQVGVGESAQPAPGAAVTPTADADAEAAPDSAAEAPAAPGAAVPERPEDYALTFEHGLFEADTEVNAALHEAGLTQDQAQKVYDLAADKLMPMVESVASEFEAQRQRERLVAHFGGAERFDTVAQQIEDWGQRHLPEEAFEAMASTYEGVVALYSMMQAGREPSLGPGGSAGQAPGEQDLQRMMRDPRYWRERDPGFIQQVTEGFRRLYPDSE